jgi:hypothetical protein
VIVNILSLSPVTFSAEGHISIFASSELPLELFKVLSFNWINCAEDIPIHERGTWWNCSRSFIGPSIVKVNKLHQISETHKISNWVFSGSYISIPLKRLEESVNDLNFSLGKVSSGTGV